MFPTERKVGSYCRPALKSYPPCELGGRTSLVQAVSCFKHGVLLNTFRHKSALRTVINAYDNNELHVTIIKIIILDGC